MKVKVLNTSEPKRIITGMSIEYKILEVEVRDETGSIALVLWDEKILPLRVGETLQIKNGFINSFKGEWRKMLESTATQRKFNRSKIHA